MTRGPAPGGETSWAADDDAGPGGAWAAWQQPEGGRPEPEPEPAARPARRRPPAAETRRPPPPPWWLFCCAATLGMLAGDVLAAGTLLTRSVGWALPAAGAALLLGLRYGPRRGGDDDSA